ncbi:hypothetical protein KY290_010217 [Solanum tuberosum]|uniref:Uncharacterized protein n=1 Tax=Solanum tuberosum TaxID=4113 RepID=A0ABQ7VX54_SOLTU|nr:hypothetical protein KY289_010605 [Solanum tuberosum]KAH0773080.1 hypothetical protein KY290_010217 [Solanum tuberosum]
MERKFLKRLKWKLKVLSIQFRCGFEAPVTVKSKGRSGEPLNYPVPTFCDRDMRVDSRVKLIGHVGTSVDGGKFKSKAQGVPTNRDEHLKGNLGPFTQLQNFGPIFSPTKADPLIQRFPNFSENEVQTIDPVTIEVQEEQYCTFSHMQ